LEPPVDVDDHTRGSDAATVTMTLFGDFQCGYSARANALAHDALADSGGRLRLAYRHFPVVRIHPDAMLAAEAAEAASARGRYWEMHDRLFAHRDALGFDDLLAYGADAGVDPSELEAALRDGTFVGRVRLHQRSAAASGVVTAPTLFLDGRRLDLHHLDGLRASVARALEDDE
jgi:protein-disulfide isomerase